MTVQQGKSIIVPWLYHTGYIYHTKRLCFKNAIYYCNDVLQMKHRTVSISDDQTQHRLTVTMKNVTMDDAGDYWILIDNPDRRWKIFDLRVTTGETQRLHAPFICVNICHQIKYKI